MILKVHLHDLIAKSEHNSMLRPHPFLDVYRTRWVVGFVAKVRFISLN